MHELDYLNPQGSGAACLLDNRVATVLYEVVFTSFEYFIVPYFYSQKISRKAWVSHNQCN